MSFRFRKDRYQIGSRNKEDSDFLLYAQTFSKPQFLGDSKAQVLPMIAAVRWLGTIASNIR